MKRFLVVEPTLAIIGTIFYSISLVVPVLVIYYYKIIGIFMLLIHLFALGNTIYKLLQTKIEISEEGVKYTTPSNQFNMRWSEIGMIGISHYISGPRNKLSIYFSVEKEPVFYTTRGMLNEKFFIVNYRKKIIEEIKKYWPYDIQTYQKRDL